MPTEIDSTLRTKIDYLFLPERVSKKTAPPEDHYAIYRRSLEGKESRVL